MLRVLLLVPLIVVLFAGVPACGDGETPADQPKASDPAGDWTHVVAAMDVPYYLAGPQQGRPPEGTFKAGTKVKLVSEHGSYVRVESEMGITAHIPAGSIRPIGP